MPVDLRASSLVFSDLILTPGDLSSALFRIYNGADEDVVASFTSELYLSLDDTIDESDYLITSVTLDGLSAGEETDWIRAQNEIPLDVVSGEYQFLVAVDVNDEIAEENEDNNFRASVGTITVEGYPSSQTLVFFDDFNRSDSAIVGNGWVEVLETQPDDPNFTGSATLNIVDGKLEFDVDAEGVSPARFATRTQNYMTNDLTTDLGQTGFQIDFTITPGDDGRVRHFVGLADSSAGNVSVDGTNGNLLIPVSGLGIEIVRSDYLVDNSGFNIFRFDGDGDFAPEGPLNNEKLVSETTSYQFDSLREIDVSFRVDAFGNWTVTISNNTYDETFSGSISPLTETLNQVVMSSISGGIAYYGNQSEIVKFDNLTVGALSNSTQTVARIDHFEGSFDSRDYGNLVDVVFRGAFLGLDGTSNVVRTSESSSGFELQNLDAANRMTVLEGSDLTFDSDGLTGGTINRFNFFDGDLLLATISGLEFDAVVANSILRDLSDATFEQNLAQIFSGYEIVYDASQASGPVEFQPTFASGPVQATSSAFNNNLIAGSSGDDQLNGGIGADTLVDGDGNDVLSGGFGDDNLVSVGSGDDQFDGGAGFDQISYANHPNEVTINLSDNTISGVGVGSDTIENFEGAQGSLAGGDTLIGDDQANSLSGLSGDDILAGRAGNDLLVGGDGNDDLDGGEGRDVARYDFDQLNGGFQGISASLLSNTVTDTFGDIDTLSSVEDIWGSIFDDTITGNAESNLLDGNAGNDLLSGGIGNDVLIGGAGDDDLFGGSEYDVYVFSGEWGNDVISDPDAVGRLEFRGYSQSDLLFEADGADLVISSGPNDVRLTDYYLNSASYDFSYSSSATWTISPTEAQYSEGDGTIQYSVTRTGGIGPQTVYLSTAQDAGSINEGDYEPILNTPLEFDGSSFSETRNFQLTIIEDAVQNEGIERFRIVVQENAIDPLSTALVFTTFSISENDLGENEAPNLNIPDSVAQSLAIEENTTAIIGLNPSDDTDSEGNGLTYSISGSSGDLVTIDQNTGFLSFVAPPDFENPFPSLVFNGLAYGYEFTVTVTDSGGLSDSAEFFVRVTNVDDEPAPLEHASTVELEYFARESAYGRGPLGSISANDDANLLPLVEGWEIEYVFGTPEDSFRAISLRKDGFAPVLAFRGTVFTDLSDWAENFAPGSVGESEFNSALSITGTPGDAAAFGSAPTLSQYLGSQDGLIITGHSQGGAQAQLAAIEAGAAGVGVGRVVTFNSAGIDAYDSDANLPPMDRITHFVNASDVVSVVGSTFLEGEIRYYDHTDTKFFDLAVIKSAHVDQWMQSELRSYFPEEEFPNSNLTGMGPDWTTFTSSSYSPLDFIYGQDQEYLEMMIDFISIGYVLDDLEDYAPLVSSGVGGVPQTVFNLIQDEANIRTFIDDVFVPAFSSRGQLEAARQDPELGLLLGRFLAAAGTLAQLIEDGAELIIDGVFDVFDRARTLSSQIAEAFSEAVFTTVDQTVEGLRLIAGGIHAIGEVSQDGVAAGSSAVTDWLLDRLDGPAPVVIQNGAHAGSSPAILIGADAGTPLSSAASSSLFLLTESGGIVQQEGGNNVVWGLPEAIDGLRFISSSSPIDARISSFDATQPTDLTVFTTTDALFVHGASFGDDDVLREAGSAILKIDFDGDGESDATVTMEGNYRLASFVTEIVEDGTYIRYLGNALPEAANDFFSTTETRPFATGNVLANDTDGDGDTLSVAGLDLEGTQGLVIDNGDGTFKYSPNGAFDDLREGETTTDTFGYFVSDGVDTVRGEVTVTITGEDHPDKTEKVDIDFVKQGPFGRTIAEVTVTEADGTIQTDTEALGWFSRKIDLNEADVKITSGGPGYDVVSAIYGGLGVSSRADSASFKDRLEINRKESLKLSLVDEHQFATRLLLDFAEQEGDVQLVFLNDGERVAKDTFSYENGMLELTDLEFDKVKISGSGRDDVHITGIEFDRIDEEEFRIAEVDSFDFL